MYQLLKMTLASRARSLGLSEDFIELIHETDDYEELQACISFLDDFPAPTYIYSEWEL